MGSVLIHMPAYKIYIVGFDQPFELCLGFCPLLNYKKN